MPLKINFSVELQRKIYEATIFFMGFVSFVFLIGAVNSEIYQYDYIYSVDGLQVSEKGKAVWSYKGLMESITKEGNTEVQKSGWDDLEPQQPHVEQVFLASETFIIFAIISILCAFQQGYQ
eukprot:TRINITY_DN12102_c0_g1_i1.p2 TRINITY_DN12102_c0_g1~~TRINITY_DN12102_c0_g1_i1.p2  ORF type:complete len:121 (-),score=15.22 TRINITY_DN12102_c0_g1_i1:441-803(-)